MRPESCREAFDAKVLDIIWHLTLANRPGRLFIDGAFPTTVGAGIYNIASGPLSVKIICVNDLCQYHDITKVDGRLKFRREQKRSMIRDITKSEG